MFCMDCMSMLAMALDATCLKLCSSMSLLTWLFKKKVWNCRRNRTGENSRSPWAKSVKCFKKYCSFCQCDMAEVSYDGIRSTERRSSDVGLSTIPMTMPQDVQLLLHCAAGSVVSSHAARQWGASHG